MHSPTPSPTELMLLFERIERLGVADQIKIENALSQLSTRHDVAGIEARLVAIVEADPDRLGMLAQIEDAINESQGSEWARRALLLAALAVLATEAAEGDRVVAVESYRDSIDANFAPHIAKMINRTSRAFYD
jgi:uncharacterized protein YajQ (UPF0234 family)